MMAQAKPDKSRQASANKPLGIEMLNAIDLLVLGYSDAQVAEQVGVTRQTICQWRHDSPQFLSELNRRRQGVWQAAHDRFRALMQKAIQRIEAALDGEDGLAVARDLLNRCGFGTVPAPSGETDPEGILYTRAVAQARRELGEPRCDVDELEAILKGDYPRKLQNRVEELMRDFRAKYLGA
jgi:Homeodomain-like domain